MTLASDSRELKIVRTFAAPARLLFAMWTDPRHFGAWMGPEGFTCHHVAMDARVGGSYRAMIWSPEQGDNWFFGTFRELLPHSRIVMTFEWDNEGPSAGNETIIELTFEERDGCTIQTFRQSPFRNAERRDSHAGGWSSSFGELDRYLTNVREEPSA